MATGNDFFTGFIDENGDIWVVSASREYKKIGIDSRKEAELVQAIQERDDMLENWRGILIENGLMKIPKTAEEIAQEAANEQLRLMQEERTRQMEINQAFMESFEGLSATIKELNVTVKELQAREYDGNGHTIVNEPSPSKQPKSSQNNRKIAGASKSGDIARPENIA